VAVASAGQSIGMIFIRLLCLSCNNILLTAEDGQLVTLQKMSLHMTDLSNCTTTS